MDLLKQHRGFLIIIALAAIIFANGIWAYKEFVPPKVTLPWARD